MTSRTHAEGVHAAARRRTAAVRRTAVINLIFRHRQPHLTGRLAVLGSVSVFFAALLTVSLNLIGGLSENIRESSFTGASLLSSDSGGYVLVAVLAFFAGVLITVLIFSNRKKQ